jgi:DNA-binding IclR family transcriptional regulator
MALPSATAHEAFFASRAMQALEVLAFGPATVTQIADALDVHSRTARRLLNRMVHDGWLLRHDGGRPMYTPTLRIVALAAQLAVRDPLIRSARQPVQQLHVRTGEPVHLAVPSYRSTVRLLHAAAAGGPDDTPAACRDLAPAHATAAGKLLLAYRTLWSETLLKTKLAAVTEHTLTDPRELRADLQRTRERGYAIEEGELHADHRALAAPITHASGEVIAALAVSTRRARAMLNAHRDELLHAARRVSAALA